SSRSASTGRRGGFSRSCGRSCRGASGRVRPGRNRAPGSAEEDITVLTLLKISGFALIDEAEIAFGPGLTAVTGETGAGKSILVEALGLLRGGRAGADLIRTGRDEARVEAIVELPVGSAARARLLD